MATLFGAWALRAETTTGSLKPGKSADLAIVALPDRDEPDPFTSCSNPTCPSSAPSSRGTSWPGVGSEPEPMASASGLRWGCPRRNPPWPPLSKLVITEKVVAWLVQLEMVVLGINLILGIN